METTHTNTNDREGTNPLPLDSALALRVDDAAKAIGLSRSSIYMLIGEGSLRSVRVAGRRLIPTDALRDLLRAQSA
jgi:excisionase family DNA binding protein